MPAGQQGVNPRCHAAHFLLPQPIQSPRQDKECQGHLGKKKKNLSLCKGLLKHYWSEKAEGASLPSAHGSPPLQLFITSHSGTDNLLKILQQRSRRPSLERRLPPVPGREGLPGSAAFQGRHRGATALVSALLVTVPVVLIFCFHCSSHPLPYVHSGSHFLYYGYWSSQPARAEMWDRFNKNNRFSGSLEW